MLETIHNIENIKYGRLECESAYRLNSFLRKILCKEKKDRLKLTEIFDELKKLNEPELPVIPFEDEETNEPELPVIPIEDEEIKIDNRMKNKINTEIDRENGDKLEFHDNKLSSIGLNIFSECLKFFPNLEELYLYGNPIGNNGLKIFSENLHFIPKLTGLELGGENDMKYLSSHFKDIPNLEFLNTSGDNGVKYLCENINEIPKLRKLWLDDTEISDIGREILLENLHKCRELEELNTHSNRISNYDDFKQRMTEKHPNKSLKLDAY